VTAATVAAAPTGAFTRRWERLTPYAYIAPFFLLFLAFGLGPLVFTGWVSMHEWKVLTGDAGFVGLRNFAGVFSDPNFWKALRNTFAIFLISTIPGIGLSLWFAVLLNNRSLRAQTFWRMVLLVPNVTPLVTVAIVFSTIFGRNLGPVAWILQVFGLPEIDWVASAFTVQIVVAIMVIWRWTGYNTLIYLAAMQAVPDTLYDAAEIDGANRWQSFLHVTVPSIRPTILFSVVTSTVGGLQIFTEPLLFTNAVGGSDGQGLTLTLLLYSQAFGSFNFGYASAIAIMLLFVVLAVALLNFALARLIRSA